MRKAFCEIEDYKGNTVLIEADNITKATIQDLLDAGCDDEFCGVYKDDETDEYYDMYTKKLANLDEETDLLAVKYWDGSNNKIDIFERIEIRYVGELEFVELPLRALPVAFDYEISGERYTQSNTSGYISPYYYQSEI